MSEAPHDEFFKDLGRLVYQSGLSDVFGISCEKPLSESMELFKNFIGFFAYHCDESITQNTTYYHHQLD